MKRSQLIGGIVAMALWTMGWTALFAEGLVLERVPTPPSARSLNEAGLDEEGALENLSGVAAFPWKGRAWQALVFDEGCEFLTVPEDRMEAPRIWNLLRLLGTRAKGSVPDEIDLEGAAWDEDLLFLAGSASLKRRKALPGLGDEANLARVSTLLRASGGSPAHGPRHSDWLWVLSLSAEADGGPRPHLEETLDLRETLGSLALLRPFLDIPSKDNGLDIEALAARQGQLWLGCRGPVLRGRALVARLDREARVTPLLLDLKGLGIRAMTWADHPHFGRGLFLVAGPTMVWSGPFFLYRWSGMDPVFFQDRSEKLECIGELPLPRPEWKAESLYVAQTGAAAELVVAFDGPSGGAPHFIRKEAKGVPVPAPARLLRESREASGRAPARPREGPGRP